MIDRRAMLAATVCGAAALGPGALAAGKAAARAATPARARDLTGVWTNAWYTMLQRPKELKTLVVTPAEAAAYEAPRRALHGVLDQKEDELGQARSEFTDEGPGLARVRGQIRSSWIVDPADGRIPWTPAARAARKAAGKAAESIDNVELRDTGERCLTASGVGPPILNSHDANLVTLVLAPGCLAIVAEKNHDTRIVRIVGHGAAGMGAAAMGAAGMGAAAPAPQPAAPRSWQGTSLGHWEGATLVVETSGLRPGITRVSDELSLSGDARVTERFTRTGPAEIAYAFEVTDPSLFTQTWKAEMVFRPARGQMFEFACHEGNYSLPTILTPAPKVAAK